MRTTKTSTYSVVVRFEKRILRRVSGQVAEGKAAGMTHCLALWSLLVADLTRCTLDQSTSWLIQLIEDYPLVWIAEQLKLVAAALRDFHPDADGTRRLRTFIRSLGLTAVTYSALLGPIAPLVYAYIKCPNGVRLSECLTCVEFWSRVPFSRDMTETTRSAYLAFEEEIGSFYYDPSLLKELRAIVHSMVASWKVQVSPRHSAGATSEVTRHKGLAEKEKFLVHNARTSHFSRRYCLDVGAHEGSRNDYSRWVPVAKTVLKMRSIAAEPTMNQYLQQGLLYGTFDPLLPSLGIFLHDSGNRNRELAVEGSRSRMYGTIDLSNASDSVTQHLVRAVFDGTDLGFALQYCRTTHMDVGGKMIKLKKFASMGSAVCFPVECIIFEAIIRLAEARTGVHRRHAVYGDDLVVHEDNFAETLSLLNALNFTVNSDKTFPPHHPFKESCGIEAYDGFPFQVSRLSRSFPGLDWSLPGSLESYVKCRNELFAYPHLRRYMTYQVTKRRLRIPYIPLDCPYFGMISEDTWRGYTLSEESEQLQAPYVSYRTWGYKEDRKSKKDEWALRAWLRSKFDHPVSDDFLPWLDEDRASVLPVVPTRIRRVQPLFIYEEKVVDQS